MEWHLHQLGSAQAEKDKKKEEKRQNDVVKATKATEDGKKDQTKNSQQGSVGTKSKRKQKTVFTKQLSAPLQMEFQDLWNMEKALMEKRQKKDVNNFVVQLGNLQDASKDFNSKKRELEAKLRKGKHQNHEGLKSKELQIMKEKKKAQSPSSEELKQQFTPKNFFDILTSDAEDSNKEKSLKDMVTKEFGERVEKMTRPERRQFKSFKEGLSKEAFQHYEDDEKDANQLNQLRCIHDENTVPCHQGKFLKPGEGKRADVLDLNPAWVEHHFGKKFTTKVKKVAKHKICTDEKNWKHPKNEKRWVPVPMGFNEDADEVPASIVCDSTPILCQQGELESCLFTSVASAMASRSQTVISKTK